MITQKEIQELQKLQIEVETLKKELKRREEILSSVEVFLLERVKIGEKTNNGRFFLSIKKGSRTIVAWKEVFIRFLGKEKAEEISAETPAKTYEYLEIRTHLNV